MLFRSGQRDTNLPFVDGYTITPRGQSDLTAPVNANFDVTSPWDGSSGPIELTNSSTGAGDYLWSMGDGESYNEDLPTHSYSEAGTFTITLTAFSLDGNCSSQMSVDIVSNWVGVEEIVGQDIRVYPNPTPGTLRVSSELFILEWEVIDSQGRTVLNAGAANMKTLEIETFQLTPGLYTLNVNTELGKQSIRFIRN